MWLDALDDFWWLERHGMRPHEVDAMPAADAARLFAVTGAVDEGRRRREKSQKRKAATQRR